MNAIADHGNTSRYPTAAKICSGRTCLLDISGFWSEQHLWSSGTLLKSSLSIYNSLGEGDSGIDAATLYANTCRRLTKRQF
jgi:hypothetical protein